jgi:hypothetical protein
MKPTPKLLADWCTLLMNGYQSAAEDYRRDPCALNQQCLDAVVVLLHNVAKAAPVLLPEIWPKLRLVNPQALWHTDPQFNWDAAEMELRVIQAAAMRCEGQPKPQQDSGDEGYVLISSLWRERFPGQRYRSKNARTFLEKHGIRYRKPRDNRLKVHAADWHRYWAKADSDASHRLEEAELESMTGDTVETPLFLENAAKLYGKIRETKRRRQ